MSDRQQLHFHCASAETHSAFLQRHSEKLLELSETHSVRVFSRDEKDAQSEEQERAGNLNNTGNECHGLLSLQINKVFENLQTQWLGSVLVYMSQVDSTQNVMKNLLTHFPDKYGWVATTDHQSNGRGRRGTSWTSPLGSVALTLALQVNAKDLNQLVFLQYIAALAICEVALTSPQWRKDVSIKWPNDIYSGEYKIAGVLCEATVSADRNFNVFVGVGVNVCNKSPTTCLLDETQVTDESISFTAREAFIGQFVTAFERSYDEYRAHGFQVRLEKRYLQLWMHTEQEVHIDSADGPKAVVQGLAPNGWVRVLRLDWNAIQDLPPETTSLDVKQKVVKKK